jgi:ferric iron reductase protein FhuF
MSSQLVFSLKSLYSGLTASDSSLWSKAFFTSLQVVPLVLFFVLWIACLPLVMVKFTLITNIEMMKDQELIERVIAEQKLARAKRSQRVFQVMKLIRRELAQELRKQIEDKRLRGVTKKHIVESF